MSELVSKTICLPVDLAAYIEEQAGNDFEAKLTNMLQGAKETDLERQGKIKVYENQILHSRRHLDEIRHKIYDVNEILHCLFSLINADEMQNDKQ